MSLHIRLSHFVFASLLGVSLLACGSGSSDSGPDNERVAYVYQPPIQKADGWQTNDLNQIGIPPATLETLINNFQDNRGGFRHVDSIAIAYRGELVLDKLIRSELDFADDWAGNRNINLHVLNSVTKSYVSALIGIAIDDGYITDTDVLVHDYFQHRQPIQFWDESKASVTLHNWLNMRHGLNWNEWDVSYLESSNLNTQMINARDPMQFLLDRPMGSEPGSTFAYSTGISFGIGRILQLATGVSVDEYLVNELLTPLDIISYDFWSLDGQLHTGSALYLETRDMLKFGQLYLDGGVWNGERIISEEWVNRSIVQQVDLNASGTLGYGYQWWMRELVVSGQRYPAYYADGFGGQHIIVVPDLEVVVALTGRAYLSGQSSERNIWAIVQANILPNFVNN